MTMKSLIREAEDGVASDNESELSAGELEGQVEGSFLGRQEAICAFQQLKDYCLGGGGEYVLELLHNLRRFRAQLRREDMQNANLLTLENVRGRVT